MRRAATLFREYLITSTRPASWGGHGQTGQSTRRSLAISISRPGWDGGKTACSVHPLFPAISSGTSTNQTRLFQAGPDQGSSTRTHTCASPRTSCLVSEAHLRASIRRQPVDERHELFVRAYEYSWSAALWPIACASTHHVYLEYICLEPRRIYLTYMYSGTLAPIGPR